MSREIDVLTLILDNNDAAMYGRITVAAHDAVLHGTGSWSDDDAQKDAYRHMWKTGDRRDEYVSVVGQYVADEIAEMIEEGKLPEPWGTILADILALSSSDTKQELGEHYLPDPDDIEWDVQEGGQ